MTELEEFSALLQEQNRHYENWERLKTENDEFHGYVTVSQEFGAEGRWHRDCAVVTRSPTGKLYRWRYNDCYNGDGDDVRYSTEVVEVERVTKMVEVTTYEEIK